MNAPPDVRLALKLGVISWRESFPHNQSLQHHRLAGAPTRIHQSRLFHVHVSLILAPRMASIVKQLRAVTSYDPQERFDLANFTQAQVTDLVTLAFGPTAEPFALPLRFTFIVGGGRLVRAKYNESLLKWFTAGLREVGFEDDRGASIGSSCCYKFQEDLDENLHYVHVFPRFVVRATPTGGVGGGAEGAPRAAPTAAERVVTSSFDEFKKMVNARVVTWSEKRKAATLLTAALARMDDLESRMAGRAPLTEAELAEYATLDRAVLTEKGEFLHAEIKGHVANGLLTAAEYAVILQEMGEKIKALADAATAGDSSKRAAAAAAKLAELTEKRDTLKAKAACPVLPPMRGSAEIQALRSKLAAIDRLEKKCAGRLLSVAEAKEIAAREDAKDRIAAILSDARGWFEDDAAWTVRLEAAMNAPLPKRK